MKDKNESKTEAVKPERKPTLHTEESKKKLSEKAKAFNLHTHKTTMQGNRLSNRGRQYP